MGLDALQLIRVTVPASSRNRPHRFKRSGYAVPIANALDLFRAARACQRSKAVCCASHTSAALLRSRPSQRSMRSAIAVLIAAPTSAPLLSSRAV